ncbi:FkbM family methyltransferase [Streptomonospora salina]|uniref:FkbM family methyltransferase n=1 Tax=Streptomonospora salina TaxID=104205 RepID=A0A841E7G0_9ACTN|nr:FkbM family methyltransferase [Streptomonospora salina]MBB5999877.1 FkbM family methyltransferase [Streptomonospora salina]
MRRHPTVRRAARGLRARLPHRLRGATRPARPTPPPPPPAKTQPPTNTRDFELALPRRDGAPGTGPATLTFSTPRRLWVPRKLETNGLAGFEPETLACFLAALEHAHPGAVLDVGANVGLYGLLAAAHSRRSVYAFEPTPHVAAAARSLAAANGLPVEVQELAMADRSGSAELALSTASDASNSLAAGFRNGSGRIQVQVDTLSHWCERTGTTPAVVKIDTETTEPDVIAGGVDVLRRSRPWIFCEVLPGHDTEERLTELLGPLHYTWHQLNGEFPAPARTSISGGGAAPHQRMWLFAPHPPAGAQWESARGWHRALQDCTPTRAYRSIAEDSPR